MTHIIDVTILHLTSVPDNLSCPILCYLLHFIILYCAITYVSDSSNMLYNLLTLISILSSPHIDISPVRDDAPIQQDFS